MRPIPDQGSQFQNWFGYQLLYTPYPCSSLPVRKRKRTVDLARNKIYSNSASVYPVCKRCVLSLSKSIVSSTDFTSFSTNEENTLLSKERQRYSILARRVGCPLFNKFGSFVHELLFHLVQEYEPYAYLIRAPKWIDASPDLGFLI